MSTRKPILTTKEVLGILSVGPRTLALMILQGKIHCGRTPGGHRRFDPDEVERARNLLVGKGA